MTDTAARQRQLIGSTAAWAANNIVLGNGEIGIEVVSGSDVRMKVGDGTLTFSALPYASASSTTINTATQAALDAKLALAGGTMTGLLVLSGDPATALGAATKQYVDGINSTLSTSISGKLSTSGGTLTGYLTLNGAPTSNLHAATKAYVDTGDAAKVSKSGDTMTGALVLAADPANALEAATKQYVDGGAYQTTVGGSSAYAGKVVKLNSGGLLDSSLLPVSATYLGTVNLTVAYALSGSFTAGNYYAVSATGTIDSSWATRLNGSPTTCSAGQTIIYNGSTSKWDLVGDTTSSSAIAGKLDKTGGTMTGALILAADPTTALGAATKQYADTMLPKAGGTMTGLITLSADPTSALHAATKQYVDAADTTITSAYTAADTALSSSLTTSINGKLSLSGGTLTGALTLSGAPTSTLHAATKAYVDAGDALAVLRSNNLSDLSSVSNARTNLGLGSLATLSAVGTAQLTDANVTTAKLADASVTSAKIADGNVTTAKIADNSVTGAKIALGSDAQGDIMYYNGTDWVRLAAGSPGQFLKTNGTGANPVWATASGGSVLLGTLTTTSGVTQTLSGLSLGGFTQIWIVYKAVSGSNGGTSQSITIDGVAASTPLTGNTQTITGHVRLYLTTGIFETITKNSSGTWGYQTGATSYSTTTTALVFGWVGSGNFDAGSIDVYGVP